MKIAVCCCTYHRPKQLGHLIHCFEAQDYPHREMVILDDAGQYGNQTGDRWRLVSVARRFPSLADKRNAVAGLVSPETEVFAIWDDDDLYLPWALSAHAAALAEAEWSRPSLVLHPLEDRHGWTFRQHQTGGLYHGGWAYTRRAFAAVGGYPAGYSGPEDRELMLRLERAGVSQADPIVLGFRPAYVYCWGQGSGYHISGMLSGRDRGEAAWRKLGRYLVRPAVPTPGPPPWFDLLHPVILPGVLPRPF
jgi:hypothetical protein